jgi:preprotein translocase subunit SecG
MQSYTSVVMILVATLLIITILLQVRGQGSGMFGASESNFRVRRGMERFLFQFTIALIVLFLAIGLFSARLPAA